MSGSSERYRTKPSELSPFNSNQGVGEMLGDQNSYRQPVGDVGNIEVITYSHPDLMKIFNFFKHVF